MLGGDSPKAMIDGNEAGWPVGWRKVPAAREAPLPTTTSERSRDRRPTGPAVATAKKSFHQHPELFVLRLRSVVSDPRRVYPLAGRVPNHPDIGHVFGRPNVGTQCSNGLDRATMYPDWPTAVDQSFAKVTTSPSQDRFPVLPSVTMFPGLDRSVTQFSLIESAVLSRNCLSA